MKCVLLIAALLGAVVVGVHPLSVTHANTVFDAAHACQQGGYATLQGSDGSKFQNAGQCTSFVARGGTIVGISACIVSGTAPGTGCLTLDNATAPLCTGINCSILSSTDSITLTGVISFSPTSCTSAGSNLCPPGTAAGAGTYSITGSNAQTGTFTATADLESQFDLGGAEVGCSSATFQYMELTLLLTPSGGTPIQVTYVVTLTSAGSGVTPSIRVEFLDGTTYLSSPPSGVSIQC